MESMRNKGLVLFLLLLFLYLSIVRSATCHSEELNGHHKGSNDNVSIPQPQNGTTTILILPPAIHNITVATINPTTNTSTSSLSNDSAINSQSNTKRGGRSGGGGGGGGRGGGGGGGRGGGGGGGGGFGWGWGYGGVGGGGGGGGGVGWGWGGGRGSGSGGGGGGGGGSGGGAGWRGWVCGGQRHSNQRKREGEGDKYNHYKIGEYAECMGGGRCKGMKLECPLHCGGPCFYDCHHICRAHCRRRHPDTLTKHSTQP